MTGDADRYRRVQSLFERAVELDREERAALLDRECADDPELRAEVEALLASDDAGDGTLAAVVHHAVEASAESGWIEPGTQIGPYEIVRVLGHGGMGEVYEARQREPVERNVALKLIKWGMDTREVVARFESERIALARMGHPAIARVFDAGSTDRGRPYFAMELVRGVPITEYCNARRLTTGERLALFTQVCEGVQHAHQRGIIHRDIKPSNVLVEDVDGQPTPKIIDFGVAKATDARAAERSVFTQFGQIVGTPEYMSPEQAEMTAADVDTRTDVYSLGVLLYELLVGALPFEPTELREKAFDEIRRVIREDEPARPSTKLSSLGDASSDRAQQRRTSSRALIRELQGDLDWITMRALEKDRARRYGSASELIADIRRHLDDEPVLAGPPTAGYRVGKFVRRHRVGVAVAGTFLALLVAFGVTMAIQARRLAIQRDAVIVERDEAAQQRATAQEVSLFLVDLFEVSDPSENLGRTITARELLDRGAARLDSELVDQPRVRANLLITIGLVYEKLGLYEPARRSLERALEVGRTQLGELHDATKRASFELAGVCTLLNDFDCAIPMYERGLEIAAERGDDDLELAELEGELAFGLHARGETDRAREILESSIERIRSESEPEHLAFSLNNLAMIYSDLGEYARAEPLVAEALSIRERVLGPNHQLTLGTRMNLATQLDELGRTEESVPIYEQILATQRVILGEHEDVAGTLNNLATTLNDLGRLDESEAYLREAVAMMTQVFGEQHPNVATAMGNHAGTLRKLGRFDEAEALQRKALEIRRATLDPDHVEITIGLNGLSRLLHDRERYDEAATLARDVVRRLEINVGPDHPYIGVATMNLGRVLHDMGELVAAAEQLSLALEVTRANNPTGHSRVGGALSARAWLALDRDRPVDAEPWLREAVEILRDTLPEGHADIAFAEALLGESLARQGRPDAARPLLEGRLELLERELGAESRRTLRARRALGSLPG